MMKCFALDTPATSAAVLCGLNRNTTQRVYTLLRERIVQMACEESSQRKISSAGSEK